MKRVAILGLGLMGGSLALALKREGETCEIVGYGRQRETCEDAQARGVVDAAYDDPAAAVEGADLVVVCVPVLAIPELCRAIAGAVMPGTVVTDVGSTKGALLREVAGVFRGDTEFVGSHPIAGSERIGLEAADASLYEGATCVVTPADDTSAGALSRVSGLWERAGGRVVVLDPEAHDRVMARTSHLPHLVASALVAAVCREGCSELSAFCGSGLRDTTRVAAGSEEIWHDIAKTNATWLHRELKAFGRVLDEMTRLLEREDFDGMRAFLAETRQTRQCMGACRHE